VYRCLVALLLELGLIWIGVAINILLLRSLTRLVAALPRRVSVVLLAADNFTIETQSSTEHPRSKTNQGHSGF
jgi:hypothetical protein